MIDYRPYLDVRGYPGCRQYTGIWDGGDTAAILGNVIALTRDKILHPSLIYDLIDADGIPRRHYNTAKWYGQSDRFSRDQLIPMICAGIDLLYHSGIEQIYESHKRRWFLTAWNTKGNGKMDMPDKFPDITGPEIWALWLRYRQPKWRKLVLWLLDFETLFGSITWRWFRKDRVCRNHMLVLVMSNRVDKTLVSALARKIVDWNDLKFRWAEHCDATGEFPTAHLFP